MQTTAPYTRYALYLTPPAAAAPLAARGAAWLGWDIATGQSVPQPNLPIPLAAITERPRKYGFHATLKAPFAVAPGMTADQLKQAAAVICARTPAFTLPGLDLITLGRFIALVPETPCPRLQSLAADLVTGLDTFRAPMTADELAERDKPHLNTDQRAHLHQWGYPHVLDQYRPHFTLTKRLPKSEVAPVLAAAETWFADHCAPQLMTQIALVGQRADGMFETVSQLPLLR